MRAGPQRTGLAGEAYTVVRERILRGEIPMGHAISRRGLAAELGMSFLPVAEAMLRLEMEGLVECRSRSATRVRLPSRDEMRDRHLVRAALESHAAKLFCELASARERDGLLELGAQLDGLCAKDRVGSYVALHGELHRAIAAGARCVRLASAIDDANALLVACASVASDSSPRWWRVEHGSLTETVVGDDPAEARRAMWGHLHRELDDTLWVLAPPSAHRRPRRRVRSVA